MIFRILLWSALSWVLCASGLQRATAAEATTGSVEELTFLSGVWEGSGWIRHGPDAPKNFNGRETVELKAGGRVLAITGHHTATDTGKTVHDAFALISPGSSARSYRMQSFLAAGPAGDFEAHLEQGAFVWGMTDPRGGKIRYTIRVVNNQWQEIGEYSADGKQWNEFFGMTLNRVSGEASMGSK